MCKRYTDDVFTKRNYNLITESKDGNMKVTNKRQ